MTNNKKKRPGHSDDPFNSPEWRRYAARANRDLVPMIRDSSVTISIVPRGETDIKFALELGLSVMMGKPIIAVVWPGVQVPAKLVQIADRIVEWDPSNMDSTQRRMHEAMISILGEDPHSDGS